MKIVLALGVAMLLGACGPAASPPAPHPKAVSIGFTATELKDRFNRGAEQRKVEYRIISTDVQPTDDSPGVDRWLYQFTNRIGFFAMVNRSNGSLRSVTFMGSGDGSFKSGADMFMAFSMLIRAVDTSITDDTANEMTFKLFDAIKTKKPVELARNGLVYQAGAIDGVGFLIMISPTL